MLESRYKKRGNSLKDLVDDTGIEPVPPAVVTQIICHDPDQINKATSARELAGNLGMDRGRVRTIAARYHYHQTCKVMLTVVL